MIITGKKTVSSVYDYAKMKKYKVKVKVKKKNKTKTIDSFSVICVEPEG